MKKNIGFTSFEFYFVMAAIGLVVLVGIQRYFRLAEDTQKFSFELLAQHFSTSVYNMHSEWILLQQASDHKKIAMINGNTFRFTDDGWPLGFSKSVVNDEVVLAGCRDLWLSLLQNPEPISFYGGDPYGSRRYNLLLTQDHNCRFEMLTQKPQEYYFDYSPKTGQLLIHIPVIKRPN